MVKTPNITCPKCSSPVKNNDQALQCEGKCESWYHIKCENISKRNYQSLIEDEESSWVCSSCSSPTSRRSQFMKDSGPSKESLQGTQAKNGKKATKKAAQAEKLNADDLNPSVQKIGAAVNQLIDSVDYLSSKYDDFFEEMAKMKAENLRLTKAVTSMKKSHKKMVKENNELRQKVHAIEQSMISGDLEIAGIPTADNENCENIFRTICAKLDCPIADEDVVEARRVAPPIATRKAVAKPTQQTIVVTLRTSALRQRVLDARKAKPLVTVKEIGIAPPTISGNDGKFFINQRLTPYYRHLFWLARQTKTIGYKYCWVKHGCIYLRKNDQTPTIKIASEADLPTSADARTTKKKDDSLRAFDGLSSSEEDEDDFAEAKSNIS